MYWLRRPPYMRFVAAGFIVLAGLVWDLRPAAVAPYPYAADPIPVGADVAIHLRWRDIPVGLLPAWEADVAGTALIDVPAGTPLLPDLVGQPTVPRDWWAVTLALPDRVAAGTRVRVVVGEDIVEGIVAGELTDTGFGMRGPIAFPAAKAAAVATAAADNALVVMVGTGTPVPRSDG